MYRHACYEPAGQTGACKLRMASSCCCCSLTTSVATNRMFSAVFTLSGHYPLKHTSSTANWSALGENITPLLMCLGPGRILHFLSTSDHIVIRTQKSAIRTTD
eukprot:GHRR01033839.1.p2 GENE.GHRR01033839.1~~GHRR01033839.1.p2  ORF type:complete len:103 (+),score=8.95 GHRR01033839.1:529-837(+)